MSKIDDEGRMALWCIHNPDKAADEIERLRKGIQDYLDGDYENARRHRHEDPQYRCEHGQHYWEDCGQCIDAHFQMLLDTSQLRQGEPR